MGAAQVLQFPARLVTVECARCAMTFAVPEQFDRARRNDHKDFYCPAGHVQYFPGKSDEEKLRADLERERRNGEYWIEKYRSQSEQTEHVQKRLWGTQGALKRTQKRVAAGVCPCCKRSFKDLSRHMAHKHPDYGQ